MSSGIAGSTGLVSACGAGLGASAPHPPSKIDRDNTPRESFSGTLRARALQPSLSKDGESSASLANEPPLCEVFSIRDLILSGRFGHSPHQHHDATILACARRSWKDSQNPDCPRFECATAGPESHPDALQSFPLLRMIVHCVPPATPAQSLPPNGTIVGCSPASWRDIPSGFHPPTSIAGMCARWDDPR